MTTHPGITLLDLMVLASRESKQEGFFVNKSTGVQALDPTAPQYAVNRHKQVVHRALQRLVNEKAQWQMLKQVCSITTYPAGDGPLNLDTDPARYRMPVSFGGRPRAHHLTIQTGSPRVIKVVTFEHWLDMTRRRPNESGEPEVAAFVRMDQAEPTNGHGYSGFEMRLYPKPSASEQLVFPYQAVPQKMDHVDDVFFFHARYDEILEAAVKYAAALEWKTESIQLFKDEYAAAIERAVTQDSQDRPAHIAALFDVNLGPGAEYRDDPQWAGYPSSMTVDDQVIM